MERDCGVCECDKKISVRFCPKCKSVKVKYVMGLANAFGLIPNQRCLDCGFEMQSFPILTTTKGDLAARNSVPSKKGTIPSVPLKGKVLDSSGKAVVSLKKKNVKEKKVVKKIKGGRKK
ncbi:MAG: hypothetical protein KJ592_00060 [Nanoarchaeota archaeon]|nr:hypothetical protein [Nanoarchaeota archaeon]